MFGLQFRPFVHASDKIEDRGVGRVPATTLLKTLVDPAAPAAVRVRAAEAIFNHAAHAIEMEDIEGRVAELERAAEFAKSSGR